MEATVVNSDVLRQSRGRLLAGLIDKANKFYPHEDSSVYLVPGQSPWIFYRVVFPTNQDGTLVDGVAQASCECPDYENRKLPCKHIYAVKFNGGKGGGLGV